MTPFNGGTWVVPGSHKDPRNPRGPDDGIDSSAPIPGELQVSAPAGSVFMQDTRVWHSGALNQSEYERTAVVCRYAPWWLNLNPTHVGKTEHTMMVVETGGKNYEQEPLRREVYEALPAEVKPLYRHWVENKDHTQSFRQQKAQSPSTDYWDFCCLNTSIHAAKLPGGSRHSAHLSYHLVSWETTVHCVNWVTLAIPPGWGNA